MSQLDCNASLEITGEALFISDLHLCQERPEITQAFFQFLNNTAAKSQHLFILGDLFEYWAGDDDMSDPWLQRFCQAIAELADTQVYFMHGNRDFLIGQQFETACKLTVLNDPTLIKHEQSNILLSHGDALCTDDEAYQTMRQQFRQKEWQQQFLSQPLALRKTQIAEIRAQSESAKAEKSMMIMDVNAEAVNALMREYNFPPTLIHGHTHRPNTHALEIDGHLCTRHVLGDWYEQGSYLRISGDGLISNHSL